MLLNERRWWTADRSPEVKPPNLHVAQAMEKPDNGKKNTTPARTEYEKLRGTWRVVELNYLGEKQPLQEDLQWSIGKNRIVMNYTLDPAGRPKKIVPGLEVRQDSNYHLWGDNEDTAPAHNKINMSMRFYGLVAYARQLWQDGICAGCVSSSGVPPRRHLCMGP